MASTGGSSSSNKATMSSNPSSYYNPYVRPQYPLNSGWLIFAGVLSFIGGLSVLIAFSSPYWIVSFEYSYSQFVRLGLWESCFSNYRHPHFQFDKIFDGCNYIFSDEYQIIRTWLLPEWMIFVQAMVSIALIFSLLGLIAVSILVTRFLLFMEQLMLTFCILLCVFSGVPMFLAVCVFGAKAFERSWLQYPSWNYLSWSYGLAVFSIFMFIGAFFAFIMELRRAKDRRGRMNNLVFNMQRY